MFCLAFGLICFDFLFVPFILFNVSSVRHLGPNYKNTVFFTPPFHSIPYHYSACITEHITTFECHMLLITSPPSNTTRLTIIFTLAHFHSDKNSFRFTRRLCRSGLRFIHARAKPNTIAINEIFCFLFFFFLWSVHCQRNTAGSTLPLTALLGERFSTPATIPTRYTLLRVVWNSLPTTHAPQLGVLQEFCRDCVHNRRIIRFV